MRTLLCVTDSFFTTAGLIITIGLIVVLIFYAITDHYNTLQKNNAKKLKEEHVSDMENIHKILRHINYKMDVIEFRHGTPPLFKKGDVIDFITVIDEGSMCVKYDYNIWNYKVFNSKSLGNQEILEDELMALNQQYKIKTKKK